MFAGILAASTLANHERVVLAEPPPPQSHDPRLVRLKQFLSERDCPLFTYAKDLLDAADRHNLDWRLLPSIALVETSGGRETRVNNPFGWSNGKQRFASLRESIHTVAERLANSPYYRGKEVEEILWVYNPREGYPDRVLAVMEEMALN